MWTPKTGVMDIPGSALPDLPSGLRRNRSGYLNPLPAIYTPESERASLRRLRSAEVPESPIGRQGVNLNATAHPLLSRTSKASSLDSPGMSPKPMRKPDLLVESYSSSQFRDVGAAPPTPVLDIPPEPKFSPSPKEKKKEKKKQRPCLCKACTLRREAEEANAVVPLPNEPLQPPRTPITLRSLPQPQPHASSSPALLLPRSQAKLSAPPLLDIWKPEEQPQTTTKETTKTKPQQPEQDKSRTGKPQPGKKPRKKSKERGGSSPKFNRQGSIRRKKPGKFELTRERPLTGDEVRRKSASQPSSHTNTPVHKNAPRNEDHEKENVPSPSPRPKRNSEGKTHHRTESDSSLESLHFVQESGSVQGLGGLGSELALPERRGSLYTTCQSSFNFQRVATPRVEPTMTDGLVELFDAQRDSSSGSGERTLTEITTRLSSDDGPAPEEGGLEDGEVEGADSIRWKRGPLLGRGAFGSVWLALTLGGELLAVKEAAIKAVDEVKAQKEYEKIQREVFLLKSLRHANIVSYLGTCLVESTVWIFMQYVPGGSLASLLHRFGPLDESVVATYTPQILSALAYIHGKNILHRDVKGSNIMLMPSGVIKLIDFGCAKRVFGVDKESNEDVIHSMKGTPFWIAPEVISETGQGTKSDIWSMGCTVVEMGTGKAPWSELGKYAALHAIASGNGPLPSLPNHYSTSANLFLTRCLHRYDSLEYTLQRYLTTSQRTDA